MILFGVVATVALRNWSALVYAGQLMMVFAVLVHLGRKHLRFRVGMYFGFYGAFALWCLLSTLWAHEPERALAGSLGIVQFVLVGTVLAAYVIAERTPEFLLNCLAWSVVVLAIVLIVLTPLDVWRESLVQTADASSDANRVGYSVRYHPNALGRVLVIGILIWLYKFRVELRHRLPKMLLILVLVAILLLTKSRLSIALLVALVLLFLILNARNIGTFTVRTAAAGVLFAAAVWAVLNIPVLYDAVGFRFMAMFGADGGTDASTSTRADMAEIAFELFGRNPFLGVGFENFSYHYFYEYSGWAETYAHNNFSELLAGLGLIGIACYYAVPVWVLFKMLRNFSLAGRSGRALASILLVLSIGQIAADFASISYTLEFVQLATVLLFSWASLNSSPDRNAGHLTSATIQ